MTLSNESEPYVPTYVFNCRACLVARNAVEDLAAELGAQDATKVRRAVLKARCEAHR